MKSDCYDYVRSYYGVQAHIGVRVRMEGREGVIVGARFNLYHYVHVRFDGRSFAVNVHPWDLEYLGPVLVSKPARPLLVIV